MINAILHLKPPKNTGIPKTSKIRVIMLQTGHSENVTTAGVSFFMSCVTAVIFFKMQLLLYYTHLSVFCFLNVRI